MSPPNLIVKAGVVIIAAKSGGVMTSSLVIDITVIVISILALWKGADWVVESASVIGKRIGLSDSVIGLTIVAFGTSAPEFAVTLSAAWRGQGNISVGNVVGSNIFNLGFVLGGVAAFHAIKTTPGLVKRDGFVLISTTVLLFIFLVNDLTISPLEGSLLLIYLISYLSYLFWKRVAPEPEEEISERNMWPNIGILLIGLVLVVGGGHFLVDHASSLARSFGVSTWVIGVTIVAAGTSAPEIAVSFIAVLRGHHGISIGNLIGSDIFNMQGVLGLAAILSYILPGGQPLQVDSAALSSIVMLMIMVTVVVIFMRTGWVVSRVEGALLIVVNLIRWVFDFT